MERFVLTVTASLNTRTVFRTVSGDHAIQAGTGFVAPALRQERAYRVRLPPQAGIKLTMRALSCLGIRLCCEEGYLAAAGGDGAGCCWSTGDHLGSIRTE